MMTSPATKPVWTVRPIAPPVTAPLPPIPSEEEEESLRYTGQPERGEDLGHKTYVEAGEDTDETEEGCDGRVEGFDEREDLDETEEEKEVAVPVMLNC